MARAVAAHVPFVAFIRADAQRVEAGFGDGIVEVRPAVLTDHGPVFGFDCDRHTGSLGDVVFVTDDVDDRHPVECFIETVGRRVVDPLDHAIDHRRPFGEQFRASAPGPRLDVTASPVLEAPVVGSIAGEVDTRAGEVRKQCQYIPTGGEWHR